MSESQSTRSASVTVSMIRPQDANAGTLWAAADVKRAARAAADRQAGKPDCGYMPRLPRPDKCMAKAADGQGLTWEENGRQLRAQAWSPGPFPHSYWLKVWQETANFPGEMRLAYADADGNLSAPDGRAYDAQGDSRIHRSDGSKCYGAGSGCAGCLAERVRGLTGRLVRVTVPGDPAYGQTVRWGTLREVRADVAVFDGYCDCNGIRDYAGGTFTGNGVRVDLADIREVQAA